MPSRPRPDRHVFRALPRRPIRVVLDGVERLANIGTMFRLCDAWRVEKLYVCGFDLEIHKRRLVSAAAGTLSWVPWASGRDAIDVVRESRADGYAIAAVELADASVPPDALRPSGPLCLVIGAEGRGVSADILAIADHCIEIPSDGIGGSINLTTAAAIVLYEVSKSFPLAE